MSLVAGPAVLRPIRPDDAEPMTAIADDWDVARNLTERFPHPYTRADAEEWIGLQADADPQRFWIIEHDGRVAGGIGLTPFGGYRQGSVEIGYWLGRDFWGRGLASAACGAVADLALAEGFRRLEAGVFARNPASARVLEKCGFIREATLQAAVDRDGVCDLWIYARLADGA